MMRKIFLVSIFSFLTPVLSMANSLKPMDQSGVQAAFNNNTIATIWLTMLDDSIIGNGLALNFNKDGQVHGKFGTKPANEPQEDQGTWSVKNDGTLCLTWKSWNKAKESCVSVYDLNNTYLFARADGTYEMLAPKPGTPASPKK